MEKQANIFIADRHGLAGRALRHRLDAQRFENVSVELGAALTEAGEVEQIFARLAPDYVFLVGGVAGGIRANQTLGADLMRDNLLVAAHVIESARRHRVKKLLYLASSCVYPKFCAQPMAVDAIMSGKLEPTNEPYGTAKLAGLILCQAYRQQFGINFISAIPANVFGPGDDFSEDDAHVVGAVIRRIHEAARRGDSEVIIWGSGAPRREFIFADDLADACVFLMDRFDAAEPINIGVGVDWSIRELAETIKELVGYSGRLVYDTTKPDGMPAKLLDSSALRGLGWKPRTALRDGLRATYQWYLEQRNSDHEPRDDRPLL